jgi:hypothetical protein
MHRWLIALFALHFILNVSAFSLGETALRTTAQAVWTTASPDAPAVESCDGAPAVALDHMPCAHGLLDDLPDLPDTLPRSASVLRQPVEPGRAIRYLAVHHALPALDTPLRPPKAPGV